MKRIASSLVGAVLALPVWYSVKPKAPEVVSPEIEIAKVEPVLWSGKSVFFVDEFSEYDVGLAISFNFSDKGEFVVSTNDKTEGEKIYKAILAQKWSDTRHSIQLDNVVAEPSFIDVEFPLNKHKEFVTTFLKTVGEFEGFLVTVDSTGAGLSITGGSSTTISGIFIPFNSGSGFSSPLPISPFR